MAATAAAAVGSSFSTFIRSLKCIRSNNWPCDPLLRLVSTRMLLRAPIPHPLRIESISICAISQKRSFARTWAAVAQQETVATAPEDQEEELLVQVGEEGEEVTGDGENEADAQTRDTFANTKLYFGNLPYNCDSAQLAGIIQEYGSPELVEVLYDRETGRSRGFAFVVMSSLEDCNAVIEHLDGSEYGGRILRVNFANKPRPKEPLYPETDYKLFVGNLAWSVSSESLIQAFQPYGNVVGARILYDGETGRSRGYGFVSYSTESEMEAALQSLNGVELAGRPMRVSRAEGKRQ